ncbi:MAG TPA: hypothetical protein P5514_11945 [Bacteroidales bacterium]|nr:hypothetical protein [Bacteroidales bacterium]HRX97650.1 hypothetical protein [Bacteroidales bacterium]
MKKIVIALSTILVVMSLMMVYAFQTPQDNTETQTMWYQVTVVESVVPGGLGRSRMISLDENGKMEETKLENFFSMAGINFGNIRENDQQITNKITELTNDGWHLYQVTSGVYSGNNNNNNGIFITRYLFSKVSE